MRYGLIYKITNKINGKSYIGQTVYSAATRFTEHVQKNNGSVIHNAIVMYGKENFLVEELYSSLSMDDLNESEKHFIKSFNTLSPNGYNIDEGGNNIPKTKEAIEKASAKKRGKAYKNRRRGIIATNIKTNEKIEVEVVKDLLVHGFTNLSNVRLVLCGKRKKTAGHTFQYRDQANQSLIGETNRSSAAQRIEAKPSKKNYASTRHRYLSRKDEIIKVYKETNSSYKASEVLNINRNSLKKLLRLWNVLHDRKTACINRDR